MWPQTLSKMQSLGIYLHLLCILGFWAQKTVQVDCCARDTNVTDPGCFDSNTMATFPDGSRMDPDTDCSTRIFTTASFESNAYCNGDLCQSCDVPVRPSPDTSGCPPLSISSLTGDPVLTGFNGDIFEFFGETGHNYSVLSHQSLTLNMQLVAAGAAHLRHQGGKGTFAGGMAVVMPSTELLAYVDEPGNMTFSVNSVVADIEAARHFADGTIFYEPYAVGVGQRLTVERPPLRLILTAVKQYTNELSGYNRGHFDLQAVLTEGPKEILGGVLGETYGRLSGAEARPADVLFEVPALTYRTTSQAPAVSTISRRLLETKGVNFPLTAHLGM